MIRRIAPFAALTLALALLAPSPVAAHAALTSTSPADGDELTEPPDEVVMVFDGELDPESSGFVVTDASGTEVGTGSVDLQVAERNEMRGAVAISEPGTYTVAWTATAADGHPEEGTFSFSLAGGEDGATPDTATDAEPMTLTWIGMLLVIGAAAVSVRRLVSSRA